MRQHENRLRRSLLAHIETRIQRLRETTTDGVLAHDVYLKNVGSIGELKRLRDDIPDLCEKILDEEEDGDE
jgi:predicted phage-related endonuclease